MLENNNLKSYVELLKWRTGRDSNPRYRCQYASLAGMWFQPAHPPVHRNERNYSYLKIIIRLKYFRLHLRDRSRYKRGVRRL